MNTTQPAVLVSLIDVSVNSKAYTRPDVVVIETSEFEVDASGCEAESSTINNALDQPVSRDEVIGQLQELVVAGAELNETIDLLGLSLEVNNRRFEDLSHQEQIERLEQQLAQEELVALAYFASLPVSLEAVSETKDTALKPVKPHLPHTKERGMNTFSTPIDELMFSLIPSDLKSLYGPLDNETEVVADPLPVILEEKLTSTKKENSDVPNPLHFGNMDWKPESTLTLPIVRNGSNVMESTVQPSYRGAKKLAHEHTKRKTDKPTLVPKTKKSKTMNPQQQQSNQFSAVPAKSVVAKTNSLEDLVKNGIGSQVVKSKSGYAHSPKATSLLLKAMSGFKNTTAKQTIDKEHGIDGVDFINTASSGDTPLGRALDINYHIRFQYQSTGWFASVGAVWFYLLADTQDESLRNLYGVSCRNIRERITPRHVEGFRTIIADATWAKINSNKHFVAAIVKNELPYVCFYAKNISDKQGKQTTQVVDSSIAYWYVAVIEEIARTLKESAKTGNTELIPDFSFIENLYENAYRKQA